MLSTDSLPRKWSMRNTCDSSKTAWITWSSARAEARSVPNGFSMMTPVRSVASPEAPSMRTIEVNATGGMASWYSRLGAPPISLSGAWAPFSLCAGAGSLLQVPAELRPQRGQDLPGELAGVAGVEPLVQRGRDHRRGHALVHRGQHRPPALTGIGHAPAECGQVG